MDLFKEFSEILRPAKWTGTDRFFEKDISPDLKAFLPDIDSLSIEVECNGLAYRMGDICFLSDGKNLEIPLNQSKTVFDKILEEIEHPDFKREFQNFANGVESSDYRYDHKKQEGA